MAYAGGVKGDSKFEPPTEDGADEEVTWDFFEVVPPIVDNQPVEDKLWYQITMKTLKVLAYIVTFAVVLGGAVFAKFGILLMTSRLHPDRKITYCDRTSNSTLTPDLNIPAEERVYWTWLIFFAFSVPELFTLFRSVRFCIFKGQERPSWKKFLIPFATETVYTLGLGLFAFSVLPSVDSAKGAILCTTVYIVPGILSIFSGYHGSGWNLFRGLDITAVFFQGTVLFMWVLFPEKSEKNLWVLPIAMILISFGFWQNFVGSNSDWDFSDYLEKKRPKLLVHGYFSYMFISIWKILIFFGTMCLSVQIQGTQDVSSLFDTWSTAFAFDVTGPSGNSTGPIDYGVQNEFYFVQNPLFLQVFGGLLCYVFAKYACKICIQQIGFALPLMLAAPTTVLLVLLLEPNATCFFNNPFYGDLEFIQPTGNFFTKNHGWIFILWFISQVWVTHHIWLPGGDKLARTEDIFQVPMYSGILVDQSIALNRKREKPKDISGMRSKEPDAVFDSLGIDDLAEERDTVPRIYACATMWHETKEEMLEIMKSILRMDQDQNIRRIALRDLNIQEGYYEYETNIFFDDAFQLSDPDDPNSPQILNPFVRDFISVVDEAAMYVHEVCMSIRPPMKYPTPYGGRLEWSLPGKTKMIIHLKDKIKIRHKKRWSQCMYMYYLLGLRLIDIPGMSIERKDVRAANTFILALDGDVDFQPRAVEHLVTLMRRNPKLGAACGRIHPTGGSGLMVWYQKFEYATGHWLQKATEHMIGAVLCSPGCFSLFRGKALMSDNVMKKYTTLSTEPLHYVQYDQGEDRWLCTLILQQGYRVDYCAASDSWTHAPEDFNEFYNQRRRWVPSTTANIMDLLTDFRRTIKNNPDISFPYIVYQFLLMFGTIMGPGTIFLMLVGALNAVFGVEKWTSFGLNLAPLIVYSLVCYYCKSDIQLQLAKVLSVAYSLLMVAVVVGIAVQVAEEGLLAPSSLFLVIVASSFIFAAILHPLEFGCLIHGLIYFITIPSMYLLLIIFSVFNLNNVSWGTREGPKVKTKQDLEAEKKAAEEMQKKAEKGGMFGFLQQGRDDKEGSFELSFAGLFKLMCCTSEKKESSQIAASLDLMAKRLEAMDAKLEAVTNGTAVVDKNSSTTSTGTRRSTLKKIPTVMLTLDEDAPEAQDPPKVQWADGDDQDKPTAKPEERDDMVNPYWINDKSLIRRKIDSLSDYENKFWYELIEKYLKPIDANPVKEKAMTEALLQLRNKSVFSFFMLNSIFVLLIFILELKKKSLHITWPWGNKELEIEPIGFVFVAFFAVILLIQFVAMLFHRFATLSQILVTTDLSIPTPWTPKTVDDIRPNASVAQGGVGLIRALQQQKLYEESAKKEKDNAIHIIEQNSLANQLKRRTLVDKKSFETLDERYEKNANRLSKMTPKRQSEFFKAAVPVPLRNRGDVTVDNLMNRRSRVLSMRKSSAASGNSYTQYSPVPVNLSAQRTRGDGDDVEGGVPNEGYRSDTSHDC